MSIKISELLKKSGKNYECRLINERDFDVFARITTKTNGSKCVFLMDKRFIADIDETVAMVITNDNLASSLSDQGYGICIHENPRGFFFELLVLYEKDTDRKREKTVIGDNCVISDKAVISPYDVRIGNNVTIGDYVIINPNTVIGDNVTIQAGALIAEQDFNVFVFEGVPKQIYHSGQVIIGSNVIIGPETVVGQALYSYGRTIIRDNTFIGAMVNVGHNSTIGSGCEICGNTMLGGYCSIGNNTRVFMSVTIANATTIGNNVTINMGSVVVRDVQDGKTVFGNPAREMIIPK